MNRYTAILLALLMAVLSILPVSLAEEAPAETTQPTETAETAETVEAAVEDQVLATLSDGTVIMQSEVDAIVDQITSYYSSYGYDMTSAEMLPIVRQMAMETHLQEVFYKSTAAKLGADQLTEEENAELTAKVDEVYEGLIGQVYTYYGLEPAADATEEDKASARQSAIAMLDAMGYTYDYVVLNETESFLYDKVSSMLTADLSVSEEEVVAHYNETVESDKALYENDPGLYETNKSYYGTEPYYIPEGFRGITHILLEVDDELLKTYQDLQSRFEEASEPAESAVAPAEGETEAAPAESAEQTEAPAEATEEPVTEEMVEAARQAVIASVQDTIDEIKSKLAAGTPWADLVAEYSTDPGMSQEPYKTNGYEVFADSTVYDPAFVQAAFSIDNIGDVSEPYVGMYGIYMVHYTRDVPAGPVELTEELHKTLEEELLSNAKNQALDAAYHEWEETAAIEYTEAGEAYRPEVTGSVDEDSALDQ